MGANRSEASLAPSLGTKGVLQVPAEARGVVVFAHGSGSGRHSPRNQFVASKLHRAGLATLMIDLLDESESMDRAKNFDIDLLAHRLQTASDWVQSRPEVGDLPVGYFGASTGAAVALRAAARQPERIRAVVSRGGRPDLALGDLPAVRAPTLLIVGSDDHSVLYLNQEAQRGLAGPSTLAVVPGATHLFEEPGALEQVAKLARDWFLRHLCDC